ncbi:MAG TPA: hypothetical protein VG603_16305 [Chitinophagales bacterium]|nr:hypothetical protein [Chitinophagales bacterium]
MIHTSKIVLEWLKELALDITHEGLASFLNPKSKNWIFTLLNGSNVTMLESINEFNNYLYEAALSHAEEVLKKSPKHLGALIMTYRCRIAIYATSTNEDVSNRRLQIQQVVNDAKAALRKPRYFAKILNDAVDFHLKLFVKFGSKPDLDAAMLYGNESRNAWPEGAMSVWNMIYLHLAWANLKSGSEEGKHALEEAYNWMALLRSQLDQRKKNVIREIKTISAEAADALNSIPNIMDTHVIQTLKFFKGLIKKNQVEDVRPQLQNIIYKWLRTLIAVIITSLFGMVIGKYLPGVLAKATDNTIPYKTLYAVYQPKSGVAVSKVKPVLIYEPTSLKTDVEVVDENTKSIAMLGKDAATLGGIKKQGNIQFSLSLALLGKDAATLGGIDKMIEIKKPSQPLALFGKDAATLGGLRT